MFLSMSPVYCDSLSDINWSGAFDGFLPLITVVFRIAESTYLLKSPIKAATTSSNSSKIRYTL